jgi:hypothetical protein
MYVNVLLPHNKQLVPVFCHQCFWLLLYAHRHRSALGAAGHIILTPANQLMVLVLKIWSLSNPGSNHRPFDHWPTSLPSALTGLTTSRSLYASVSVGVKQKLTVFIVYCLNIKMYWTYDSCLWIKISASFSCWTRLFVIQGISVGLYRSVCARRSAVFIVNMDLCCVKKPVYFIKWCLWPGRLSTFIMLYCEVRHLFIQHTSAFVRAFL